MRKLASTAAILALLASNSAFAQTDTQEEGPLPPAGPAGTSQAQGIEVTTTEALIGAAVLAGAACLAACTTGSHGSSSTTTTSGH